MSSAQLLPAHPQKKTTQAAGLPPASPPMSEDKFHDECGVVGIFAPGQAEIAQLIYYGLYALQHRGQESCGIAVSKDGLTRYHKSMGLVSEVFSDEVLGQLEGDLGIGHVRYSTTGESFKANAQPLVVKYKKGSISLGHNGNLVNAHTIREMLEDEGVVFQTTIDTEVIANLIARNYQRGLVSAIKKTMELVKGAYALTIMTESTLVGVRDPFGLRPLCLGRLENGYVLASETCALDTIGAEFVRDIEPGEIVIINHEGLQSHRSDSWTKQRSCIFELVYFARPDSVIDGINAHTYRFKTGRVLAEESPAEADYVIAVPDSGIPAAIGFSEASGIPYAIGLIKNRYVGRTFIQPNQKLREQGVRIKLNVLKKTVSGKRVVLVDDSIVRGTTMPKIVELLRKAGAREVHVRISSPPVTNPCHFGIDTPDRDQLIGARMDVPQINAFIGADSLAFLSIDGMQKATAKPNGFCRACFDGDYPMEVPRVGDKFRFEEKPNPVKPIA